MLSKFHFDPFLSIIFHRMLVGNPSLCRTVVSYSVQTYNRKTVLVFWVARRRWRREGSWWLGRRRMRNRRKFLFSVTILKTIWLCLFCTWTHLTCSKIIKQVRRISDSVATKEIKLLRRFCEFEHVLHYLRVKMWYWGLSKEVWFQIEHVVRCLATRF
jgi:hypothetical protein